MGSQALDWQESRLFSLLESQFPWLAKSYIENFAPLSAEVTSHPNLEWHDDKSRRRFFRANLNLPSLLILSEPLSRFRAYKRYIIPIDDERSFYAGLGIVPVYFANMNRISCLSLWGSRASNFFEPYSRPLRPGEDTAWQLGPTPSSPAQYSSMNFILIRGAIEKEISPFIRDILSDYFQYAFWSFPRPGFACSPNIFHSRDNINHILKVAKSIYLIKKIHEPRQERLAPYYNTLVQRVDLEVIGEYGPPKGFWVYLAQDVVDKISAEVRTGDVHNTLINGLVYEFKDKVERPSGGLKLLSVVADFLPDDVELFKTLTAFSAVERFRHDPKTFGFIGLTKEFRADVERRYRRFLPSLEYSASLFSVIGSPFEYIFDELFPLVVQDEERVFFVYPSVLAALLKLNVVDYLEAKDVSILVNFIRLIQNISDEKVSQMGLRLSEEGEYFKKLGVNFHDLWQVLVDVYWEIRLSRLLCEHL